MLARCFAAAISALAASHAFHGEPLAFDHFHSVCEIEERFVALADAHPRWFATGSLGASVEGRAIPYLRIEPPGATKPVQAIWLDAAIHGGELASPEPLLALVELIAIHAASEHVPAWLANRRVVLVPVINVDGRELSLAPPYPRRRTNLRSLDPDHGVDLNRDFPRGDEPALDLADPRLVALAPETAAIVRWWLTEGTYDLALSFHTSANLVLTPWRPRQVDAAWFALAVGTYRARNGGSVMELEENTPIRGTTMEWFHHARGAIAATIEMSALTLTPERNGRIPAEHRLATLALTLPPESPNVNERALLRELDQVLTVQLDFLCTLLAAWPREREFR